MNPCINLSDLAGDVYRVTYDEARDARDPDPCLLQLPCRYGVIYPYGGNVLALEIDCHGKVAARVSSLPGVRMHQVGTHETTLLFDVALFDQVAAIVHPRKRRHVAVTAERLAQLAAARSRREALTQSGSQALQQAITS